MKRGKTVVLFSILTILIAVLATKVYGQQENLENFFNSKVPGIKIRVDATAQAQPKENISFTLSLEPEIPKKEVNITKLDLRVYGFINGTIKNEIYSEKFSDIPLSIDWRHHDTISLPEHIYGAIYGEISLTYTVKEAYTIPFEDKKIIVESSYPKMIVGFAMTRINNVYLKLIEGQLLNLIDAFDKLNQTFRDCFGKNLTLDELLSLNETYWQLNHEYNTLREVKGELDNTRTTVIFLAAAAIFFIATTAYLVLRRPKTYW